MIKWLLHRAAHWFGLNLCVQFDFTDEHGHHIGAMCATCGRVHPDTVVTFKDGKVVRA